MELKTFVSALLTRHGCLVEETGDAGLQVIFPEDLQKTLNVEEMEIFAFPRGEGKGLSLVHKGRDFIEALEPLTLSAGSFSCAALPIPLFEPKDPEELLAAHLTIQNGVFRLNGVEKRPCSYLVVHYRIIATADTRAERLTATAINEQTHTIPEGFEATHLLDQDSEAHVDTPATDLTLSLRLSQERVSVASRNIFHDFIRSLDKRLERDLKRLQNYYMTLASEIEKRLRKKGRDQEEVQKAASRLEATKADYLKKIQDARDKYALEIVIEPVSALRMVLPVTVLQVTLQRRKKSRRVEIPVNPVTRRLESLLCVNCREAVLNFSLCDDLHVLCSRCFPECRACR